MSRSPDFTPASGCVSARRCRKWSCCHCGRIRAGDEFRKFRDNLVAYAADHAGCGDGAGCGCAAVGRRRSRPGGGVPVEHDGFEANGPSAEGSASGGGSTGATVRMARPVSADRGPGVGPRRSAASGMSTLHCLPKPRSSARGRGRSSVSSMPHSDLSGNACRRTNGVRFSNLSTAWAKRCVASMAGGSSTATLRDGSAVPVVNSER